MNRENMISKINNSLDTKIEFYESQIRRSTPSKSSESDNVLTRLSEVVEEYKLAKKDFDELMKKN
jgi:hypothetical protein